MKILRMLAVLVGLASFLASSGPATRADEWDKTTKVTFSDPVQVPGKVLQAEPTCFGCWTIRPTGTSCKSITKITRR